MTSKKAPNSKKPPKTSKPLHASFNCRTGKTNKKQHHRAKRRSGRSQNLASPKGM